MEKEALYKEIDVILTKFQNQGLQSDSDRLVENMKQINIKLKSGLKVQQSSANIMSFIVQDLLDYAQIKSGKFRKNISTFNIKQSIEKIMCIQRKSAEQKGIKFEAVYINICENEYDYESSTKFSPMVRTDEQRVMQVLLGLQSNALKFTQKGSVTVKVQI